MSVNSSKRSLPNPLPIFNQGKRPRRALLAHPNNQGDVSHESVRPSVQHFRKPYAASTIGTSMEKENNSPNFKQMDLHGNIQRKGNFTPYRCDRGAQSQPPENWQHSRAAPQYQEARQRRTAEVSSNFHPSKGYGVEQNMAVGNAFCQALEPAEKANAASQPDRRKKEVRVLTATAQGVKHWSQYKQHLQLLFEVYGTLVTQHQERCAQKFTLRTMDGPLNCIFWEMECKFPRSLQQGQLVRVVGEWLANDKILKSYSVRLALKEEEGTAEQCIKGADRLMRKMVGRL